MSGVDIFNSQHKFGRVFSVDEAILSFSGSDGTSGSVEESLVGSGEESGMLVQGIQFSYGRPINQFGDLTSRNIHHLLGRPQGQLTISRLAAETGQFNTFFKNLGSVESLRDEGRNTITITPSTSEVLNVGGESTVGRATHSYTFKGCIIESLSGEMNTQSIAIAENIVISFTSLEIAGT